MTKTPENWEKAIRGHWSIENKNHWRSDACAFEDKTRSRNPAVVASFMLIRSALLLFNSQTESQNMNAFMEANVADKNRTFAMIMGKWIPK